MAKNNHVSQIYTFIIIQCEFMAPLLWQAITHPSAMGF